MRWLTDPQEVGSNGGKQASRLVEKAKRYTVVAVENLYFQVQSLKTVDFATPKQCSEILSGKSQEASSLMLLA